jgi:murein DD-endopeptidase MepM/ murein hydrolase activator NlpD
MKKLLSLSFVTFSLFNSCGDQNDATQEQNTHTHEQLELTAETKLFCPNGSTLDTTFRLCINGSEAIGPFTSVMIKECQKTKSASACAGLKWDADLARKLRGTGACMSGAEKQTNGLCIEGDSAFGPFPTAQVEKCKEAGGGLACENMRYKKSFAEATLPDKVPTPPTPTPVPNPGTGNWSWISKIDQGIRGDGCGEGFFKAPRGGGTRTHKGVDFLFPMGTDLLSPCAGTTEVGFDPSGYGNYVVVVCKVPNAMTNGEKTFVSMLYGHLSTVAVGQGQKVTAGQKIGRVGRSGNANSDCINTHVHFEAIVENTESLALQAFNAGMVANESLDLAPAGNLTSLAAHIRAKCMTPTGFKADLGLTFGSNIDPFVLLNCLGNAKPTLQRPNHQNQLIKWSQFYTARTFDVNVGR